MLKYIGKRLLQTLLVLFIVSIFAFALIHLAGGNPALLLLPDGASDEAIKAMEHQLGLDQPLYLSLIHILSQHGYPSLFPLVRRSGGPDRDQYTPGSAAVQGGGDSWPRGKSRTAAPDKGRRSF